MTTLLLIVLALLVALLVLVAAVQLPSPRRSRFETERLASAGDAAARRELARLDQAMALQSLVRIVSLLLLVLAGFVAVAALGWLWGLAAIIGIIALYPALARARATRRLAGRLYSRIEPGVLRFVGRVRPLLVYLAGDATPSAPGQTPIASREELVHLVEQLRGVISPEEKKRLLAGLSFGARLVGDSMTPRTVVSTIASGELLGPMVLDDLHKQGHSRVPVIEGDIDHVVGVLYLQDLLVATAKKTPTAREAMNPNVFYIRDDQTLAHALAAFLSTSHHLFVVVNEYRETVGVLSLEDVIEALLGQSIVDEFDAHDDLRAVAARNPRANNSSPSSRDV